MNLFCLGINHRTAPIEIREKLWFSAAEVQALIPVIKDRYAAECVLTSTCNRTELYFRPLDETLDAFSLWTFLVGDKHAEAFAQEQHFYLIRSLNVVKHLFSVASGIDSLVIGDVQILNQLKEAYTIAQDTGTTSVILNRLFTNAFHAGKRARSETEIGEGAVSVSYAATELASKIFDDLSKRTALLIGAGETGMLTARHLSGRTLGKLLVANRTRSRAEELALELKGTVIEFNDLHNNLQHVDIIISAVEAPNYIISCDQLKQAMKHRGNRPLFIIDIGVPRNIEPAANTIGNIFLHDIDALNNIIESNVAHRQAQIRRVEEIILEEITEFNTWFNSLQVTPTIQQLREQFESIRQSEVEKLRHQFGPEKQEEIELLTKRIVNKILHTPLVNLRNGTGDKSSPDTHHKIHLIRHLFGLDKGSPSK